MVTYDEALTKSLSYFNNNKLAADVFIKKYALRNEEDILESSPDEMHDRLAYEFARIDGEKYKGNAQEQFKIYREALDHFARIIPQGSCLAAIGNKYQRMSAANCFVIASPEDSIEGIIRTGLELAQVSKRRGGIGISLDTLRPDGAYVNNAARMTSGAWSFADFYSYITRMIGQGGRRGATLIALDVHHPDISKFATMKLDKKKATGANISVKLSNEFMKAVETNAVYKQYWPLEGPSRIQKEVNAKEIWDIIIESATRSAEPGLLFWDTIKDNLPTNGYDAFKPICTNACSELPLSAYNACRLITINLTGYVLDAFTKNTKFDMEKFVKDVQLTVRMADNLIDIEYELIDRIKEVAGSSNEKELWSKIQQNTINGREVGIGTHGLADTLAQLGLKYGSEDSWATIEHIYKTLRDTTYKTSVELAKERGPFPYFDWSKEKNCSFIKRLPQDIQDNIEKYGRRNAALLTNAPTGCLVGSSKIQTEKGIISLETLFEINGINIEDLKPFKNIWFKCLEDIYVFDINKQLHKVSKLYWNGKSNVIKLNLSNGDSITSTEEHKFLVKINNKEAIWKKASEIQPGDKIIKLKKK
jgi:ribonucleoside-diphosphate reductase alpha chain